MASTRTQIYLSAAQRRRLDELVRQRRVPMAALIRDALDAYLDHSPGDLEAVLGNTFGSIPDMPYADRRRWRAGG
jgi:hypothetical protein